MNLAECFAHWGEVHALTLETFGLFRDDELAYVAYRGGWSVQEIMLHIANTEDGWLRYVVTRELPGWPTAHTPKRYPTVASNQALLAEVHARTAAFLTAQPAEAYDRLVETPWGAETTVGWVAWHVLEHEIHHRGELSLVLGLLGREGADV